MYHTEFGQKKIPLGNAFPELGSIGTPLTTNGSAQYLDHLEVVEWVALIRFLFAVWHYQSTLDFAFFILEYAILKRI